jgi:hypothetical protein
LGFAVRPTEGVFSIYDNIGQTWTSLEGMIWVGSSTASKVDGARTLSTLHGVFFSLLIMYYLHCAAETRVLEFTE